jgi:glycine betaine/proline transport system substrate-binding protein
MLKVSWLRGAALAATIGLAAAAQPATAAVPESTDPIKFVLLDWTGNHLTNHIAGEILSRMGYKTEYVTTAQAAAWQGLEEGSLQVNMEQWLVTQRIAYDDLKARGKIVDLGLLGLEGREAWYYPAYVAEKCPGLPALDALKACAGIFQTSETAPKGRLVDFPEEWTPESPQWIDAFGLDLVAIPAGGEGAIIAELKSAKARQEPVLVMFYEPHWAVGEFDLKPVDLPKWDAACESDPAWGPVKDKKMDCYMAAPTILKVATAGFEQKYPAAAAVLKSIAFDNASQAPLIKRVDVDGETVEAVAKSWVDDNKAVWEPWVAAAPK